MTLSPADLLRAHALGVSAEPEQVTMSAVRRIATLTAQREAARDEARLHRAVALMAANDAVDERSRYNSMRWYSVVVTVGFVLALGWGLIR